MAGKTAAVSYLRVSGLGQVDGDGFDRQREAIDRYAAAHGCALVEEFRDEGVSGTRELENRPGLAALLAYVTEHRVGVVLVENADRLARDLVVSEVILRELRAAGVRVIAAAGNVDLTGEDSNPTAKLIRQILAAVAEFDREITVLKLRAARDRARRRDGRCEGRKPFGARPGEADTMARIRQLRRKARGADRRSYAAIAAALNAEGHPTRTGRPWAAGTVHAILRRAAGAVVGRAA